MFDKNMLELVKAFTKKAAQDIRFTADYVDVKWDEKSIDVETHLGFQVVTENDYQNSIEWRFIVLRIEFNSMGFFRLINDNHFDLVFNRIVERVMEAKPLESARARLAKDEGIKLR